MTSNTENSTEENTYPLRKILRNPLLPFMNILLTYTCVADINEILKISNLTEKDRLRIIQLMMNFPISTFLEKVGVGTFLINKRGDLFFKAPNQDHFSYIQIFENLQVKSIHFPCDSTKFFHIHTINEDDFSRIYIHKCKHPFKAASFTQHALPSEHDSTIVPYSQHRVVELTQAGNIKQYKIPDASKFLNNAIYDYEHEATYLTDKNIKQIIFNGGPYITAVTKESSLFHKYVFGKTEFTKIDFPQLPEPISNKDANIEAHANQTQTMWTDFDVRNSDNLLLRGNTLYFIGFRKQKDEQGQQIYDYKAEPTLLNVVKFSSSGTHIVALVKEKGAYKLQGFGANRQRELGFDDRQHRTTWTPLILPEDAPAPTPDNTTIICQKHYTCIITTKQNGDLNTIYTAGNYSKTSLIQRIASSEITGAIIITVGILISITGTITFLIWEGFKLYAFLYTVMHIHLCIVIPALIVSLALSTTLIALICALYLITIFSFLVSIKDETCLPYSKNFTKESLTFSCSSDKTDQDPESPNSSSPSP